jgi:hypothetical protein
MFVFLPHRCKPDLHNHLKQLKSKQSKENLKIVCKFVTGFFGFWLFFSLLLQGTRLQVDTLSLQNVIRRLPYFP